MGFSTFAPATLTYGITTLYDSHKLFAGGLRTCTSVSVAVNCASGSFYSLKISDR